MGRGSISPIFPISQFVLLSFLLVRLFAFRGSNMLGVPRRLFGLTPRNPKLPLLLQRYPGGVTYFFIICDDYFYALAALAKQPHELKKRLRIREAVKGPRMFALLPQINSSLPRIAPFDRKPIAAWTNPG